MGCQCCRMIKSYIYDPSAGVDGRKPDSPGSSLYQPHHLPAHTPPPPPPPPGGDRGRQKHGFHNLGYSKSSDSTLMLEADNNHVNQRLHAAPSAREPRQAPLGTPPAGVYIIQPESAGSRWVQERSPSQVPVYPDTLPYQSPAHYHQQQRGGWDTQLGECNNGLSSSDELDEGVGGTPEYPCDTGDEGSVLSADMHTSTTSLSSADAKDELRRRNNPDVSTVESGISVMKSEDEEEEDEEEEEGEEEGTHSVTDSMVAEALAALEAATAGEECE